MASPQQTSLYIIATPIGNLGDISFRAIEILKKVDLILAEDTRTSGVLLKHYEISRPLQSFHNFNEHKIVGTLIERLKKGEQMALISDAGTPGISDPGFLIARACIQAGLKIRMPSRRDSLCESQALIKSGLPSDRFVFEGFIPQKKGRSSAPPVSCSCISRCPSMPRTSSLAARTCAISS